jgi:hypothetical protein
VTDGSLSDTGSVSIAVTSFNQAPVLEFIGNKEVNTENLLNFTINAMDPDDSNLTYSASNLPTNATFNSTSGSFAWIPDSTQAGIFNITFRVTDGSLSDNESVTISVTPVNRAPEIVPVGNKIVSAGILLNFTVNATDLDDSLLGYSADNLPAPANSSPPTSFFAWIPAPLLKIFHLTDFFMNAGELDINKLTYTASNLPNNASFNAETRSFSGHRPLPGRNISGYFLGDRWFIK